MFSYSKLVRGLLFPIAAKLQKSAILKEYKYLKSTDWCSEEELMRIQNEKLQKLMTHCYQNVAYYTKVFDQLGLKPEDIKSREDLSKLPILTKQIIRDNYKDLISKDIDERKPAHQSSGGSTGVPLKFMTDKDKWGIKWSSTFRAWSWYGFLYGGKIFTYGGNSLVKSEKERRKITKKDIFDRLIMNTLKCDCSDMSEEALRKAYKEMMSYKPEVIRGYPAAIYNLAKFIESHNLPSPKIKMVLTTGEMLLPLHRRSIQQIFRAPVYDGYGAGDGGVIAHECYMHEGLHITEEQCIVEITDKDGRLVDDGSPGFVITTDLDNYVFPFIRYQVGDLATMKKEKCSCGRKSRMIDQIIGRTGKTLFNKEGQAFTSIVVDNMMFKNMDYHRAEHEKIYQKIDQFQVRQHKNGDISVLIKPLDSNEPIETFDYVVENFTKNFSGFKIEIKFVDEIPKMASGKEDYCVSEYEHKG